MQKIDKTMTSYCNYCIPYDVDLQLVEKRFKCPNVGNLSLIRIGGIKFLLITLNT